MSTRATSVRLRERPSRDPRRSGPSTFRKGSFQFRLLVRQALLPISYPRRLPQRGALQFGANMGEVIRFIPKSERERTRLIREARAIYDSVFPTVDPVSEQPDKAPVSQTISSANA